MNLGEMINDIYSQLRSIENFNQKPIIDIINYWYKYLSSQFLFDETLVTDTMIWSASDTNKKDVSSVLTNWRGEPKFVKSGDKEWARRTVLEIYKRRIDNDEYFDGMFCYAIQGIYIITVSDVGDATSVEVTHFKRPDALSAYSDEPLMPEEFHSAITDKVVSTAWSEVRAADPRAWARKQRTPEEQDAERRFADTWSKMMRRLNKERQVIHVMEMSPVMKAVADRQWSRR